MFVFYKPLVLPGHLAVVMHFFHAGQERETLLCAKEPMTTVECITALFNHVDEQLHTGPGWQHHLAFSLLAGWFLIGESPRGQQGPPALPLPPVR